MEYYIVGEDRQQGALGISTRFTEMVEAPDEEVARAVCRSKRYAAGREHVHIATVRGVANGDSDR